MEKKTLSLNKDVVSGSQLKSRIVRSRSKGLTEVVVDTVSRRRVVPQKPPPRPAKPDADGGDAAEPPVQVRRVDAKRAALQAYQQDAQLRRDQAEADDKRRQEAEAERLRQEAAARALQEADPAPEDTPAANGGNTGITPDSAERPPPKARTAPPKRTERKRRETENRPGGKVMTERRRSAKINVAQALSDEVRQRSHAAFLRSQERKKRKAQEPAAIREKVVREVQLPDVIIVQDLANRMAERVSDVIKTLMKNGVNVNQNQPIDADTAELIISEFGHKTTRVSEADVEDVIETKEDSPDKLKARSPVISVMGHVDHGKTSLLDAIRKTNVAAGEAGGITQHIGAYRVTLDGGSALTFLDTPGHEAFTAMRARGAQATDIVVLVVAADDAVMPQTAEAISHARAAGVPILVAINKVDLPGSDPDRVRNELLRHEVIVEKHSGDVLDVEISALKGQGIDKLLEAIALQAEVLELSANPDRSAAGAVIESRLDIGRGPVATILVQNGTLRTGDVFVVGEHWGKVRALTDSAGQTVRTAGPSVPVEVIGLNGTPMAGDILNVVENESQAKEISSYRQDQAKRRPARPQITADLGPILTAGPDTQKVSHLQLVVKADVQGSVEAIVQAAEKIGNDEVSVRVLHAGVGAITETDVSLAEASGARLLGFNVRANKPARAAAAQKGIDIRYYSVIYALVDDIRAAASNLLSAEVKETFIGTAEILEVFKITGAGIVAGCRVTDGSVRRSADVRLLRDDTVIHEGKLKTLKRFKDEVSEVVSGQECGMAFENYANIRIGDSIEVFRREEIQRTL